MVEREFMDSIAVDMDVATWSADECGTVVNLARFPEGFGVVAASIKLVELASLFSHLAFGLKHFVFKSVGLYK
jgi:hypothetical protein